MPIFQNLIAGSGFLQGPTGATGPAANTTITEYEYVATAGQTVFTGNDKYGNPLSYTPNGIIVTLNGSVINETDEFVATNGTSLTLVQASVVNDELNIYAFPAFNVANTYTQAQANTVFVDRASANTIFYSKSGGQLTGNVSFANGANLLVPVGNTAQRPAATQGYIRYNTDLNTLESANATAWANVGSGSASSGGGGISWSTTVQNTNFIAVTGKGYGVNTATGNVTVTLPASPTIGDNIQLVDYGITFSANNLIINPNGSKIQGNTSNIRVTGSGASVGLVYFDSIKGWIPYNGYPSSLLGSYSFSYLIVAGGGAGGGWIGGAGGGAGGMITGTTVNVNPGTTYTVTVGAGGSGSSSSSAQGPSGSNSSLGVFTAAVGGGGGAIYTTSGISGGSGGGGGGNNNAPSYGAYPGGSGTSGQGNSGGAGWHVAGNKVDGGGGGGAGSAGTAADSTAYPNGAFMHGGAGLQSSVTGVTYYFAGGGGGGGHSTGSKWGNGGAGGGGGGASNNGAGSGGSGLNNGVAGTQSSTYANGGSGGTNTGGGGGGAGGNNGGTSGSGGSGVVVISYAGLQRASGGTVTYNAGFTVHTFTSSGTFTA